MTKNSDFDLWVKTPGSVGNTGSTYSCVNKTITGRNGKSYTYGHNNTVELGIEFETYQLVLKCPSPSVYSYSIWGVTDGGRNNTSWGSVSTLRTGSAFRNDELCAYVK